MNGLPFLVKLEVAFTTPALDPLPNWVDVTNRLVGFRTTRGRLDDLAVIEPGTGTFYLDCSDGRFDPDNQSGPYFGFLRPNRKVRLSVQQTAASALLPVWTGYADSWQRTWPGGAISSITVLECTDRFKLLTKRTNTGSTVQEQADLRIIAILQHGGVDVIVDVNERKINVDGYACRTLVAHPYTGEETLLNLHDAARADGGQLFMSADGDVVFQSTRFRTDNARATTSQGTFGNAPAAIPVTDDLDPTVSDDTMSNYVTVTDAAGTVHVAKDDTAIAMDGRLELDIGPTLLRPLDAPDRAADVLLLRKDPRPRYQALTVDCLADEAAMTQSLQREISDRLTIAIVPPGAAQGYSRDQYVEGIEHRATLRPEPAWFCTIAVSGGYGNAAVIDAAGNPVTTDFEAADFDPNEFR